MLKTKLVLIAFILILLGIGIAVWANATSLNLAHKIKSQQINSYSQCVAVGYPVMESFPSRCAVPGGKTFTDDTKYSPATDSSQFTPVENPNGICVNRCGDNSCQVIVCQGTGCPCSETADSCPQDCKFK